MQPTLVVFIWDSNEMFIACFGHPSPALGVATLAGQHAGQHWAQQADLQNEQRSSD